MQHTKPDLQRISHLHVLPAPVAQLCLKRGLRALACLGLYPQLPAACSNSYRNGSGTDSGPCNACTVPLKSINQCYICSNYVSSLQATNTLAHTVRIATCMHCMASTACYRLRVNAGVQDSCQWQSRLWFYLG
jgi:hypothetical protein